MKKWMKAALIGTVAAAAVTHSEDIRGIVLEYPAIYDGQSHVFTGKYKVLAAKEVYRFVEENAS